KAMAGIREVRLVRLAARLNGDMRGLSSAKTGWRRSGAAASRPKVRLFGRVDAPLCGRPAKKQSRNEQHHAGDFGVRSCGDGALHLGPLTWAQPGASCRPPEILRPAIVEVLDDPLATTQLGDTVLAAQPFQNDANLIFSREVAPRRAADVLQHLCRRLFHRPGFLSHLRSLTATMSQKSCLPQTPNSVSRVLTACATSELPS